MALLGGKCVVLSLSAAVVLLSLGGAGGASAMMSSLPPPQPTVNFSIGVQGMVWCRSCRSYPGYFAPMDASPLKGAKVLLLCRNGASKLAVRAKTNAGGYFRIDTARRMSAFTSQQCRVYVPQSPVPACGVPDFPAGRNGMELKFQEFRRTGNGLQAMYSVGDRLFRPAYPGKCY